MHTAVFCLVFDIFGQFFAELSCGCNLVFILSNSIINSAHNPGDSLTTNLKELRYFKFSVDKIIIIGFQTRASRIILI